MKVPVKNFWLDMDLTLAKFPISCGEFGNKRYRLEKDFFLNLKPYTNIEAINNAILRAGQQVNVFILSNSPNENADSAKNLWIDKYLPAIRPENRIFNRGFLNQAKPKAQVALERLGKSKLEYFDILIDDCIDILLAWQRSGGIAIKKHNRGEGDYVRQWYGERAYTMKQIAEQIYAM